MSLIRYQVPAEFQTWRPVNRLASLQNELNRLFETAAPTAPVGWSPALDFFDDNEQFVATVELPGVKKEDLAVSVDDGVLTISGERKRDSTAQEGRIFRSERVFGKFTRSVTLPGAVDSSAVKAAYNEGILTVTLPKAPEARSRQIEVTGS